jgi:DNA repair exonuclease SbcCD ATPase subunit
MRSLAVAVLVVCCLPVFPDDVLYIFSRSGQTRIHAGDMDLHSALALKDRWSGDFLWTRQGNREYLITDPAVLHEASALFARADALEPEYRAVRARLRPLEQREEQLELEKDRLEDQEDDLTLAEERRRDELTGQLRAIAEQIERFEREEERLDLRQDALEAEAERALAPLINRAMRNGLARRVR